MAKIAYLVISHQEPAQVQRLARLLARGTDGAEVVIRHNYGVSFLDPAAFADEPNIHLLRDGVHVEWGKFGLVAVVLQAIEWMAEHLTYDWLVLISGQDYPIQPLRQIANELDQTPYDGFLSGVAISRSVPCGPQECPLARDPSSQCVTCQQLYGYQYARMPHVISPILGSGMRKRWENLKRTISRSQPYVRVRTFNGPEGPHTLLGLRARHPLFDDTLMCFKGAFWFSLRRECVEYVRKYVQEHPRYVAYYRRTLLPDESFFQTILLNSRQFRFSGDNKRFILWDGPSARSPIVLTRAHLPAMFASGKHFARKFDIRGDPELLDIIDERIGSLKAHEAVA